MADPEDILRLGIEAAREGNREEARNLFRLLVRDAPDHVQGWLWLVGVSEGPEERRTALERVVALDPANEMALRGLRAMGVEPQPSSSHRHPLLTAGIEAAKDDRKDDAHALFRELCEQEPESADAWIWRAGVARGPYEQMVALQQFLHFSGASHHSIATALNGLRSYLARYGVSMPPVAVAGVQYIDGRRVNEDQPLVAAEDYERVRSLTAAIIAFAEPHRAAARDALIYPRGELWGRALGWWRLAAQLSPALPLGVVADLGELLTSAERQTPNAQRPTRSAPEVAGYAAFLDAAAVTPAAHTAADLGLSDASVAALLAHLARGMPDPAAYRPPAALRAADTALILADALDDDASPFVQPAPYPAALLEHLLARLRALTPAEVQLLHTLGADLPGAADLADLRALTDLLTLPALDHQVLDTLLTLLPALAEAAPGPAAQSYAIDGVAGLARSGTLDAVLPSEWALPDLLVAARYVNGELLYYGRERPPERRPPLLLLLVQAGDAMAGDPAVLARAAALALARRAAAQGAVVQAAFFDTRLHPPQGLTHPREVAAFVRHGGRGGVDVARVAAQALTHVQAQAGQHAQVAVQWVLHADAGAEQVGRVRGLAGRLRGSAGVGALFVAAGATPEAPALAGVLAVRWVALGSDVLHEAAARAQAVQALRQLARPGLRERIRHDVLPPRRRVVAPRPVPPPDPARALLEAGAWARALELLEPPARSGDLAARWLLAALVEGPALAGMLPEVGMTLAVMPPLEMRLRAGWLLNEVGDPRPGVVTLEPAWCVPIPAGEYTVGAQRDPFNKTTYRSQRIRLEEFRMARYPVTNGAYRHFIEAGGYQERRWWTDEGWKLRESNWVGEAPRFWGDAQRNQPNQPVVEVTWYEAVAYCAWLTATGQADGWLPSHAVIRLPSEAEWEVAAHWDVRTGTMHPWEPPAGELWQNVAEAGIGRPAPVGAFPQGQVPCGALDMAGNTWEWCASPHADFPVRANECPDDVTKYDLRSIRGGSYSLQNERSGCGARYRVGPDIGSGIVSFRLVQSLASRL